MRGPLRHTSVLAPWLLGLGGGCLLHCATYPQTLRLTALRPCWVSATSKVSKCLAAGSDHRTGVRLAVTASHAMPETAAPAIVLDPFAAKNFVDPGEKPTGRAFIEFDKQEFAARVNAFYEGRVAAGEDPLKPGYAPFCKHLFMPNFVPGLPDSVLEITEESSRSLRSEYQARTEKELPVLTRWFAKGDVESPEAKFLDVILYSREQIRKENAAMGEESGSDAPWGIVSVKAQGIDSEIPMEPITMMRNSLGVEHGGSGVALDRDAYARSVEFWNRHARVQ
mmetsp:Transcript_103004/g.300519  ORF Transcript_103004/g.300519 Transcript_103004/m.300519 type:complete len:281 (+) Transcript_103004:64-906(+)